MLRHLSYDDIVHCLQVDTQTHSFAKTSLQVKRILMQANLEKLITTHKTEEEAFFHCCKMGLLNSLNEILVRAKVNPMCQSAKAMFYVCVYPNANTLKVLDRLLQDSRFDPLASEVRIWSDLDLPTDKLCDYTFDHVGLIYASRVEPANVEIILKLLDDPRVVSNQINPFTNQYFMENLSTIYDARLFRKVLIPSV